MSVAEGGLLLVFDIAWWLSFIFVYENRLVLAALASSQPT